MNTIFKAGLAALVLAGGVSVASVASAEDYDKFTAGAYESYLIEHCTYNPCDIDYSTMPNWPSNPYYRHPHVRVYEYPGYSNEPYPPPPPPDEENSPDEQ